MDSWPDAINRAFRTISYGREIEVFAEHWKSLEPEAFTRAFESGTPEEKALALFALSYGI